MHLIQSATFKLTLWYLGIIMLLSILFSFALYRLSYDQMSTNAVRQINAVERLPLPPEFQAQRDSYVQSLVDQLNSGLHKLIYRLVLLDLATFLIGGGGSYLLARHTLQPVEDAMEAQGRFTADASHELRTPLTAMRTEIEVALRDKQLTATEARSLLASNLEEVNKLEALARGLLRLARAENTLDPAALETVSVRGIMAEAASRFQTELADKKMILDVEVGSEYVSGDKAGLIELVCILIDNAIKYSPEGSRIAVRSSLAGNSVAVSISDQGVGIKAADLPHIFSRFYRADRSRSKDKVDGYGLGLSIAKRIVDLHRGTIAVESTPGEGSTFRIKLPA